MFGLFKKDANLGDEVTLETLGFSVAEVERLFPTIDHRGRLESLAVKKCFHYSIKDFGASHGDWAILQRFPDNNAVFSNCFLLEAENISDDLIKALAPLAQHWDFDFFEFERRGNQLSVYCSKQNLSELKELHAAIKAIAA